MPSFTGPTGGDGYFRGVDRARRCGAPKPFVFNNEITIMRNVIRLGDATSHGGSVIAVAATHYRVGGIPVARVGDRCTCPLKGHDNCTIVEGDASVTVDGVPIAFDGHKTSCGAALLASTRDFGKR